MDLMISSYNSVWTKNDGWWTVDSLPLTDSISEIRLMPDLPTDGLTSESENWTSAWLCARRDDTGISGVIYHKSKFDLDWQEDYETTSGWFNDLCIPDYGTVCAVGTNGLIAWFDGTNWTETEPLTSEDLLSVNVNKDLDGWAVGKNGTILQSSGGVWSVYDSPARFNLNKISFFKDDLGYIVGDQGTFLSTKAKLPTGIFNKPVAGKLDQLHIYPNPAGNYFYVELVHPTPEVQISITDMTGRILYEQSFNSGSNPKETICISSLTFSTGLYLVKVNTGETLVTGKLLIK
jgi:hypothetical protein